MADSDLRESITPHNTNRKSTGPSVANLRTALSTYNAAYYTTSMLNLLSKRDMEYAAKTAGLSVAGL